MIEFHRIFAKNPSMEFVFRSSIFLYVFMNTQYISVRQSNFTFQDHPQYLLMSHSSP